MLYLYQLIASAFLTTTLIPLAAGWGKRWGILDMPGGRHIHAHPVPRTGGIGLALGCALPMGFFMRHSPLLLGLLSGLAVLFVAGILDDRRDLDYRLKFLFQSAAVGLTLWLTGLKLAVFGTVFPEIPGSPHLNTFATFFFLLAVINSINLADGLDGLAAGLSLLSLTAIGLLSAAWKNPDPMPVVLCTAGSLIGFLRYNTHPASVFMGDTGSQILGYLLGVSLLLFHGGLANPNPSLPLFFLGVPILDTLSVMIQRIQKGCSPFRADLNHLHHILLEKGLKPHHAVIFIYGVQMVLLAEGFWATTLSASAGTALYGFSAAAFLAVLFASRKILFDGLFRFLNRRLLLPLEARYAPLTRRIRSQIARFSWFCVFGCLLGFLGVAPLWVRPIPYQIGLLAGAIGLLAPAVRFARPESSEGILKFAAYFCGIYFILTMELGLRVPIWGTEYLWLYNRAFQVMGFFYLVHIMTVPKQSAITPLDYLLTGMVVLIFLLPRNILIEYRAHIIGVRILVFFLCWEMVWQKMHQHLSLLTIPVCSSLLFTAILAFWPWIF